MRGTQDLERLLNIASKTLAEINLIHMHGHFSGLHAIGHDLPHRLPCEDKKLCRSCHAQCNIAIILLLMPHTRAEEASWLWLSHSIMFTKGYTAEFPWAGTAAVRPLRAGPLRRRVSLS